MKVLITGAEGFIGRALVARLLAPEALLLGGSAAHELVLLDRTFADARPHDRVRRIAADITDPGVLPEAVGEGVDCIFHLASIPGGAAEANFERGLNVNLEATVRLLEAVRRSALPSRVVFASTIGVYGVPLPAVVDETTLPEPSLSYGAQKLMGEILVSDYSRRGHLEGCSLRLPGIVARLDGSGLLSAFLSDLIRKLSAGEPFVCPVAAEGTSWWMSRSCVVENLLHAATLSRETLKRRRVWLLPVLRASIAEVVAAIARLRGAQVTERVRYEPKAALQAQFANYPPLRCPGAEAAGFKHDGSLEALIVRALEGP